MDAIDHLRNAVSSLKLTIVALRCDADVAYGAGDNRTGNINCDGARRLEGDLHRLEVALGYLSKARGV